VPAWGLALLLPWCALGVYNQTARVEGAFAVSAAAGVLLAVVLIGVGLPYLVYRLSKRSRKAGLVAMAIVACLGAAGQGVALARSGGVSMGGGSRTSVVASPEIGALIGASMAGEPRQGSFFDALDAAIAAHEASLKGDELVQTRAFHAVMAPSWRVNAELAKTGLHLVENRTLPAILVPVGPMDPDAKRALRGSTLTYKHGHRLCESLVKTIDGERERAVKSLTRAGYSESRAKKIARAFARDTARSERRALAEAEVERWAAYRQLAGVHVPEVNDRRPVLGDDGQPLGFDAAQMESFRRVERAESAVQRATRALERAVSG